MLAVFTKRENLDFQRCVLSGTDAMSRGEIFCLMGRLALGVFFRSFSFHTTLLFVLVMAHFQSFWSCLLFSIDRRQ